MDDSSDSFEGALRVFFPDNSTRCTEPFGRFLDDFRSHSEFFFFVVNLVGSADANRVNAAKALLPIAQTESEKRRYEETINSPKLVLKKLQKHSTLLSQTLTNGIVNSVQRYFSSIIQSAAIKKPAILSSSQTVKIDDVLRFSRLKDLISFITDKKIHDLSYGGLNDLEKYFNDRLGIPMFVDERQRKLLRIFVESRNINVHNAGIVNDLFISRVGLVENFPYKFGEKLHFDLDDIAILSKNAMGVAQEIDKEVSDKFGLRRRTYKDWTAKRVAKREEPASQAE